ncbi:hypothetical protein AK812_SmicGene45101 [Symbiodinium microadriaticum]|uniref:Uncharacterized protein n=1 Tax=Symbiodinium microadriaticum TaxID=2951 RepID=A0A1Q9BWS1_SYMMI|nr:hypothetical protein AK812_SmicGene45101 [Symbiodinium microadriaticum]
MADARLSSYITAVCADSGHQHEEVLFQIVFLRALSQPRLGSYKAKGKDKGKSKGRWSQELTWDTPPEARHQSFGSAPWAWKHAQGLDVEAAIYAMARLCLRQETELSELRQEKSFLLHVSAGPHGILKPLIQASVKWNELRDQMKVDCSLKSELFRMMLKETAARMEKFEQTPDSIAAAEKAGGQLGHNSGIAHQEVKALLESMSEALKQDPAALNQFTLKRKLVETMSGASVAFTVAVGFRSTQCQILYDAFAKLAGLSVLQLIAANMHKERQKHGREAEEVRSLTWRYGSGGHYVTDDNTEADTLGLPPENVRLVRAEIVTSQRVWLEDYCQSLLFSRFWCAMARSDSSDVEMIDDTSSTATIEFEWTRWWNKPSEHWPGYTSWEVLQWWAERARWMMKMSKAQYRERRSRRPLKKVQSKFERI